MEYFQTVRSNLEVSAVGKSIRLNDKKLLNTDPVSRIKIIVYLEREILAGNFLCVVLSEPDSIRNSIEIGYGMGKLC
jgi:hypothetical protein